MSNPPNYVFQPFTENGDFVNQVVVYDAEHYQKVVYSLLQGIQGKDADSVNYFVVNTMVEDILLKNPDYKIDYTNTIIPAIQTFITQYITNNAASFKGSSPSANDIEASLNDYFTAHPVSVNYSNIIPSVQQFVQNNASLFTPTLTPESLQSAVNLYITNHPISPDYTTIISSVEDWFRNNAGLFVGPPGQPATIDYNKVHSDLLTWLSSNLTTYISPSLVRNSFVDSSGVLIPSLTSSLQSSVNNYLATHPPAGSTESEINALISAYLTANPPSGGSGGGLSVFFHGHFSHIGRYQGLRFDEYAQHLNFNNSQIVRQSESSWDNSTGNHRYIFPSTGRYKISLFIRGSSFSDSVENNLAITYYVNDVEKLTTNLYYYANQAAPSSGESNLIYDANANDIFYIRIPASGGHYWVNYANLLIEKV